MQVASTSIKLTTLLSEVMHDRVNFSDVYICRQTEVHYYLSKFTGNLIYNRAYTKIKLLKLFIFLDWLNHRFLVMDGSLGQRLARSGRVGSGWVKNSVLWKKYTPIPTVFICFVDVYLYCLQLASQMTWVIISWLHIHLYSLFT